MKFGHKTSDFSPLSRLQPSYFSLRFSLQTSAFSLRKVSHKTEGSIT